MFRHNRKISLTLNVLIGKLKGGKVEQWKIGKVSLRISYKNLFCIFRRNKESLEKRVFSFKKEVNERHRRKELDTTSSVKVSELNTEVLRSLNVLRTVSTVKETGRF